jgi:uncharacterized membrane protein required for colicin V production
LRRENGRCYPSGAAEGAAIRGCRGQGVNLSDIKPVDLIVFFGLFGMFILGFVQGIVRRVIGIMSMLFSLVLAAQLRDPIGNYLVGWWSDQPPEYSRMIAFGAVFVAGVVASTVGIQWFYRPTPLLPRYPVLEEVIGGLLGLFQGVILLAAMFLIIDPFYNLNTGPTTNEFVILRTIHEAFDGSVTGSFFRENFIPNVMAVFGGVFPEGVRKAFER